MFKGIDYVVGEIIESKDKKELLLELDNRLKEYKQKYIKQGKKILFYFKKNIYYLEIK